MVGFTDMLVQRGGFWRQEREKVRAREFLNRQRAKRKRVFLANQPRTGIAILSTSSPPLALQPEIDTLTVFCTPLPTSSLPSSDDSTDLGDIQIPHLHQRDSQPTARMHVLLRLGSSSARLTRDSGQLTRSRQAGRERGMEDTQCSAWLAVYL